MYLQKADGLKCCDIYDICNRVIFGFLARYVVKKVLFLSFHSFKNDRDLLENPQNHSELILLDINVLFILA